MLRNYENKNTVGKLKVWKDLIAGIGVPEDPLLKALTKIKARNPQLELETLYTNHPAFFDEKKLLESLLYE